MLWDDIAYKFLSNSSRYLLRPLVSLLHAFPSDRSDLRLLNMGKLSPQSCLNHQDQSLAVILPTRCVENDEINLKIYTFVFAKGSMLKISFGLSIGLRHVNQKLQTWLCREVISELAAL